MALANELSSGLNLMKFALNHEYRFSNYRIAYLAGFLQVSMIITVESVNFLTILTASTILDTVMNFMALSVIADFDNFFYGAIGGDDPMKDMITNSAYDDLFKICKTTSRNAKAKIPENELQDDCCHALGGK